MAPEATLADRSSLFTETILSGDLALDDASNGNAENSFRVVTAINVDDTSLLDGFVVEAGNAQSLVMGGGALLLNSQLTIRNCLFRSNYAAYGAALKLDQSDAIVEACQFRENVADGGAPLANSGGGALVIYLSTPTILDCDFDNNRSIGPYGSSGGAVAVWSHSARFVRCSFTANASEAKGASGGAVAITSSQIPEFEDCSFSSNRAIGSFESWGGAAVVSKAEFVNCLFAGNASDGGTLATGGAVYLQGNSAGATFTNCTVYGNSCNAPSTGPGGLSFDDDSQSLALSNDVLWGNTAAASNVNLQNLSSGAEAYYSCIEYWTPTWTTGDVGCTPQNPQFLDPLGPDGLIGTDDDDFRLSVASPCIDAGDNLAVPTGVLTDLSGLPRFQNELSVPDTGNGTAPIVDMGAIEFWVSPWFVPYGTGCYGSGQVVPALAMSGLASPGGQIQIDILNGVGSGTAFIFTGLQQASTYMGYGCYLNVAPLLPPIVGPIPLFPFGAQGPGAGSISIPVTLPTSLVPPVTITLQAFVDDPGGKGGFSNTNGIELNIQ